MKLDRGTSILIVGLGLLGGSYARALTKKGYRVDAITLDRESIDYALAEGMIAVGTTEVDPALVGGADLVIFALYPHVFVEWVEQYQHLFKPGAILTDVTGVKSAIVDKIQTMLRPDVEFIAAHPMAGREVGGVKNSDDGIFHGANYVVTPTEHDDIIAFVSQLTHCIAVALMTCQQTDNLEDYTGDSFRDLTRIARINDLMWSELFIENKEALLEQMNLFINKFNELKSMLETEDVDSMRKMMRHSTERRALFDKK